MATSSCSIAILPAGEEAFSRLRECEAMGSPFQSAGWVQAFLRSQGLEDRFLLLDLQHAGGGRLLLPLQRDTAHGVTVLGKIGGAHASFFAPAMTHPPIPAGVLGAALRDISIAEGIDALMLADCPVTWNDSPHPLLSLGHRPAPSDSAVLPLDGPPEEVMSKLFDREGLKKQRYKRRKLGEMGTLCAGWAPCETTVETALERFFTWKAGQFRAMGVPDPFGTPEVQRFLLDGVCGTERPIRLFTLEISGRPIAVIGVAQCGTHASGMFTAYDPDPDIARFSPGDVAMGELVTLLRAEGNTGFDLGVGEARYKNQFCPTPLPIIDIAEGFTLRGQLAAAAWLALRGAKRVIKRNPRLFNLAKGVRSRLSA